MDTLEQEIDFTPFGIDEIRSISLGVLLPALVKMGLDNADVQGAKYDTVVGIFYMAQHQHLDVAQEVWQKNMELIGRREQVIRDRRDNPKKVRQRSAVHGAVSQVHKICERMKGQPRKDVIAACVKEGINENTAKTQYYKWQKGLAANSGK